MILADTDILSAMAKVGRTSLLFSLFKTAELYITPGVHSELEHSFGLGRDYARYLFALIRAGQIHLVYLTADEMSFRDGLPVTLGLGERESIAVARSRSGLVLSNESRVAHCCREHQVTCLRLPDILRALWVENIVSRQEVEFIVGELSVEDRMQFKPPTLYAIFSEP
jgi:predicted nucleic acid-binding protein